MLVQLVCHSDREDSYIKNSEMPFEFFEIPHISKYVILVPTLDDYHQAQGEVLLLGLPAEVICLLPPAEYKTPSGSIPYALVTDTHIPHCDPIDNELTYYFSKLS